MLHSLLAYSKLAYRITHRSVQARCLFIMFELLFITSDVRVETCVFKACC